MIESPERENEFLGKTDSDMKKIQGMRIETKKVYLSL